MGQKRPSLYRGTIEDDRSNIELQYHRFVSIATTETQKSLSWLVLAVSSSALVISVTALLLTSEELKVSIQNIIDPAFIPLLIVVLVVAICFYFYWRAWGSIRASQKYYNAANLMIQELGWEKTYKKHKIDKKIKRVLGKKSEKKSK